MPYLDAEQALHDAICSGHTESVLRMIDRIKDREAVRKIFHERLRENSDTIKTQNHAVNTGLTLNYHINEASPQPSLLALNKNRQNFFIIAVINKQPAIARILLAELRRYPRILFKSDSNRNNCFHHVVANGYASLLADLLKLASELGYPSISRQNSDGDTSLHLALKKRKIKKNMIDLLFNELAKHQSKLSIMHLTNVYGNTILHIACAKSYFPAIKKLVHDGANVRMCNNKALTAFEMIPKKGRIKLFARFLREGVFWQHGAQVELPIEIRHAMHQSALLKRSYRISLMKFSTLRHLALNHIMHIDATACSQIAKICPEISPLIKYEYQLFERQYAEKNARLDYEKLNEDRQVLMLMVRKINQHYDLINAKPRYHPTAVKIGRVFVILSVLICFVFLTAILTCPWNRSDLNKADCQNILPLITLPIMISMLLIVLATMMLCYRTRLSRSEIHSIINQLDEYILVPYKNFIRQHRADPDYHFPIEPETWDDILYHVARLRDQRSVRDVAPRLRLISEKLEQAVKQINVTKTGYSLFKPLSKIPLIRNDITIEMESVNERPPVRLVQ